MMHLVTACLAFAALVSAQTSVPFKNCGQGAVTVIDTALSPYPPTADSNMTFQMTAQTGLQIVAGSAIAELDVKLLGISLPIPGGSEYDLCTWIDEFNGPLAQNCPTRPGILVFSATFFVACTAPEGTYSITMKGTSQTGQLFCVETDMFIKGVECPTSRKAPMPHKSLLMH